LITWASDAASFLPQAAKTTAATATDTTVKERTPENFMETPKENLLQSSKL
jgi:hypothetical protein